MSTVTEFRFIALFGRSAEKLTSHTIRVDFNENMLPKLQSAERKNIILQAEYY